jgi:hypothetical protein
MTTAYSPCPAITPENPTGEGSDLIYHAFTTNTEAEHEAISFLFAGDRDCSGLI